MYLVLLDLVRLLDRRNADYHQVIFTLCPRYANLDVYTSMFNHRRWALYINRYNKL